MALGFQDTVVFDIASCLSSHSVSVVVVVACLFNFIPFAVIASVLGFPPVAFSSGFSSCSLSDDTPISWPLLNGQLDPVLCKSDIL